MRTLAIGTLLGAGLVLCACKDKSKSEGGGPATVEEAKKAGSHVLATKNSRLPRKGQTFTRESTGEMKDGKMSLEAARQMAGTMGRNETSVETWVYVADNKARRTLESKTTTGKMTMNGQDQPMPPEKDPLIGVPVIVELKDGKYVATLESGTPAQGDQVKALDKLSEGLAKDQDYGMYGDTPRKVGDKWEVDPKALGGFADAKDLSGTFTVEFVEIKDFQGAPCAVLKSQFDVNGAGDAGGEAGGEGGKMTLKLKGDATSYRSLADQVDLEAKISANMIMEGSPAPEVKMQVEGPFNMTEKTTVKK